MVEIEREMKFLVNKEEFYALLEQVKEAYPNIQPQEIEQTNYYYDTDDLWLYSRNTTLRVRKKNNTYTIEKKEVKGYESLIRHATESTYPVAQLPEEIRASSIDIEGDHIFKLLGQLDTSRLRFTLSDGTNIDFDVSRYFDVIDYELEIEVGENPPTMLIQKISACLTGNNVVGKLERFIRRKNIQ